VAGNRQYGLCGLAIYGTVGLLESLVRQQNSPVGPLERLVLLHSHGFAIGLVLFGLLAYCSYLVTGKINITGSAVELKNDATDSVLVMPV
jgi:hypothetical protein